MDFVSLRRKVSNIFTDKYAMVDKGKYENMKATNEAIFSGNPLYNEDEYVNVSGRASLPLPYVDTPTGSKIPLMSIHPQRIYEMAETIGDLRIVYETIQRELFKNGVEIKPKFRYKCLVCHKMYDEKPLKTYSNIQDVQGEGEDLRCSECGNDDDSKFKQPNPEDRVILQTLLDHPVNNNGQTLIDVAKQYERDIDIIDYAAVIITRDYILKPATTEFGATMEADIKNSKIDELIRIHPVQFSIIANDEGKLGLGADNNPRWICPDYMHRDELLETPVCPKCGTAAFTAVLETNSVPFGLPVANPRRQYYAKHEIIWTPGKYVPGLLYGTSVLISIWKKAMSLFYQDEYLWKYFDKERPPKSLLAIGGRNYESVEAFFKKQRQGAMSDPFMPRPILVNTENVGAALEYIDLTPNFKELELAELRNELRQIIFTIYGIQPIFSGEKSKGGGKGSESLQLTISNKSFKMYQRFLNEKFFAQVCKLFHVEDWEIALIDVEEIDELRENQIKGEEISNANLMYAMGFDVWTDGNGKLQFSQFPNPEKQMMMGGMGSNVKQGNTDKVSDTRTPGEKATSFGGEPLENRPSDLGGTNGGSPTSGESFSKAKKYTIRRKNGVTEVEETDN